MSIWMLSWKQAGLGETDKGHIVFCEKEAMHPVTVRLFGLLSASRVASGVCALVLLWLRRLCFTGLEQNGGLLGLLPRDGVWLNERRHQRSFVDYLWRNNLRR